MINEDAVAGVSEFARKLNAGEFDHKPEFNSGLTDKEKVEKCEDYIGNLNRKLAYYAGALTGIHKAFPDIYFKVIEGLKANDLELGEEIRRETDV